MTRAPGHDGSFCWGWGSGSRKGRTLLRPHNHGDNKTCVEFIENIGDLTDASIMAAWLCASDLATNRLLVTACSCFSCNVVT